MVREDQVSRRLFLKSTCGVAASVALAGCQSQKQSEEERNETQDSGTGKRKTNSNKTNQGSSEKKNGDVPSETQDGKSSSKEEEDDSPPYEDCFLCPPDKPILEDAVWRSTTRKVQTLDPVKATDKASKKMVQQIFDGILNYPRGESAVEFLLVTDYKVENKGKRSF